MHFFQVSRCPALLPKPLNGMSTPLLLYKVTVTGPCALELRAHIGLENLIVIPIFARKSPIALAHQTL